MKTYTYKIKSTGPEFEQNFKEWIGTCRFLYNAAKELKEVTKRRAGYWPHRFEIQKQLTQAKREISFLNKVSCNTLYAITDRLDRAYDKYFKGNKEGEEVGWPKWAAKHRWKSIPFKSVKYRGGDTFKLPVWGEVRVFFSRAFDGDLRNARLIKEVDGYYLQVVTDIDPQFNSDKNQVGIDLGINYFLVTSDGEYIDNPQHYKKYERQLRIENRRLARKKFRSNNWYKQKERVRRLHLKIRGVRKDFLHKTSTQLARKYETIFVEDLNTAGMGQNSKLAKHISDVAWRSFIDMLSYKTNIEKVPPYHTSQECYSCGHIEKDNRQGQSFKCVVCGHKDHADENAANIIFKRGQSLMYPNVIQ